MLIGLLRRAPLAQAFVARAGARRGRQSGTASRTAAAADGRR